MILLNQLAQVKKIKDKQVLILLNQLALVKKITKKREEIKHETVKAQVKNNTLIKTEAQPS